jgi:pilus assembly protein Flp/PilA
MRLAPKYQIAPAVAAVGALIHRKTVMKKLLNVLRDDSGAAAAEYALILAIVGSAIALAAVALGGAVANSMNRATNCIKANSTTYNTACV